MLMRHRVWRIVEKICVGALIVLIVQSEGGTIALIGKEGGTFRIVHPAVAEIESLPASRLSYQHPIRVEEVTVSTYASSTSSFKA
ncbi:MAG TPA: hypothetical protein VGB88_00470 [Alphaproteobacteria bacterium]